MSSSFGQQDEPAFLADDKRASAQQRGETFGGQRPEEGKSSQVRSEPPQADPFGPSRLMLVLIGAAFFLLGGLAAAGILVLYLQRNGSIP
ncbi:MAG: hypothetical protein AB1640_15530 [bacterium]